MRKISDDTLLSSISIPGTHDSGAYKSGLIHNLGRDQELTITQQLEVGVRFLDIRLDAQKGGLTVYHGFLNEHLSFDDVLLDCFAFLDKNPTETIIICIKQERKNSITDKVHAYIEKDASKWFLENRVPTLGEVRGKLVLFRRFADNVDFGLNLYDGFPENTSGDFNNGVKCHVQDYYNYGSKKNMDAEWVAVEECLDYSKSSAENEYVINFTSGFYYVLGFIPQIKKTAQYVHPRFIAYATEHAADCYGIVLFDFVSENLAYAVYTTNQSVNLE
ncbi:MAG: phosphatidylinositol-specific phospholipase C [Clostridia bacterium]|nr:phosphatidylinositol-specific phospholipase C [Clostridia bacterium]